MLVYYLPYLTTHTRRVIRTHHRMQHPSQPASISFRSSASDDSTYHIIIISVLCLSFACGAVVAAAASVCPIITDLETKNARASWDGRQENGTFGQSCRLLKLLLNRSAREEVEQARTGGWEGGLKNRRTAGGGGGGEWRCCCGQFFVLGLKMPRWRLQSDWKWNWTNQSLCC